MAWDRSRRRKTDASPWQLGDDSLNSSRLERTKSEYVARPSTAFAVLSRSATTGAMSTTTTTSSQVPLSVRLTVKFADPTIGTSHTRDYDCSPDFQVTDKICRGLLHRINYCSKEFITRKDSSALERQGCERQPSKQLRYEISYQVFRRGVIWAERTFKSYQKQALTPEAASTLLFACHKIVGLYLKHHDVEFKWANEPEPIVQDPSYNERPMTPNPKIGTPLPLSCVPNPRFDEATQSYDSNSGFSVELTFNSRSRARKNCDWTCSLRLNSTQESPLNLALAEELYWRASKAVTGALDAEKEAFFADHAKCEFLEGMVGCQHFGEDALEIEVAVTNHLGPAFDHLRQRIRTRLGLFRHPDGLDCQRFLRDVHAKIVEARDNVDSRIDRMGDFDFTILELQGKGWSTGNVARVSLDSAVTYSRRSTQAILDRLQAGVADVLRGNDVGVHYAAHKRGHLVLDKAVIARAEKNKTRETFATPEGERDVFIARLRSRLRQDLDLIAKDTLSLDDLPNDEGEMSAWTITEVPESDMTADLDSIISKLDSLGPASPRTLPFSSPRSQSTPRVFPLIPQRFSSLSSGEFSWGSADMGTPRPNTAPMATLVTDNRPDEEVHDLPERRELPSSPLSQEVSFDEEPSEAVSLSDVAPIAAKTDNDDETSSQLSTPALTNGTGSSRRNSLLITPTLLRSQSGTEITACSEPHVVPDDADADEHRELCTAEITDRNNSDMTVNMTPIVPEKIPFSTENGDQSRPRASSSCPSENLADLRGDSDVVGCEAAESAREVRSDAPITQLDETFRDFTRSKLDLEIEDEDDSGPDALQLGAGCVSDPQIDFAAVPLSSPEIVTPAEILQSSIEESPEACFGSDEKDVTADASEVDASVAGEHNDVAESFEVSEHETIVSEISEVTPTEARLKDAQEGSPEAACFSDGSARARLPHKTSSRSVSGSTIVEIPDPAEVILSESAWQDYDSDCGTEAGDDGYFQPQPMSVEPTAPILGPDDDDDLPDDIVEEPARPSAPSRRHTLGILGFQETKMFEFGLRGALVGTRRFDAPAQAASTVASPNMPEPTIPAVLQQQPKLSPSASVSQLSAPHRPPALRRRAKSAAGSKSALMLMSPSSLRSQRQRKGHRHGRSLSSSSTMAVVDDKDGVLKPKRSGLGKGAVVVDREQTDIMLPRVVMMFAGMAIASQMINNAG